MGRPLKIQKYSAMTGIFVNGPTADATPVDQAFNPWNALTNAQYPNAAYNADQYYGVVGGASNTGTSALYPIVKCRAFITGAGAEGDAQIIRQKGAHKFLVIQVASINATSTVAGKAYRILTVGNTPWSAIGGPANAAIGDIFTATGVGTGSGTVQLVGTCVLADEADGALTEGNMNITYSLNDSTAQRISKLTNKFLLNFDGGNPGGAADTGDAWNYAQVVNDDRYGPNFFTDEGTEVKSGSLNTNGNATYPGTNLDLAIVENYTS